MRISDIPEAQEVFIDLGERGGDIENLKRASYYVVGGMEAFLISSARRAKYEFLLWKIVSKDHVGHLPKEVVYEGKGIEWDTPYRVIDTKPEGEVQITVKTKTIFKLREM